MWRSDSTSQAQAEVDSLFQTSIDVAAEVLRSSASFAPFMLTIARDGQRNLRQLGIDLPQPTEDSIIDALEFRGDRDNLRARATVTDVSVHEPFHGDAIRISIDHIENFSSHALVPYTVTDDELTVDTDATHAIPGKPRLSGHGQVSAVLDTCPQRCCC